ncbi:MAG TPA: hypothetical protein VEY08_00960 [Chloroflexia bacterium]|nr:hypothetical protein [Chloroflexia bacterium]
MHKSMTEGFVPVRRRDNPRKMWFEYDPERRVIRIKDGREQEEIPLVQLEERAALRVTQCKAMEVFTV